MKTRVILIAIFFSILSFSCYAQSDNGMPHNKKQMMMHSNGDSRISLGLSERMKVHQLQNMGSHVEAVQMIIGLLSKESFDKAAEIAHTKLGLTDDMKRMCNMFKNEGFRTLGLEFHKSADNLAKLIKTRDLSKSLNALHKTMSYCVQCHATYRQ